MTEIFQEKILGKYFSVYYKCANCSLIKPENPHWLVESYTSAIAATDVGLVSRNYYNGEVVNAILTRLHQEKSKLIDLGGGYGLLCRILRDKGWDCYTQDKYCENLFAKKFEAAPGMQAPTLLAFEVFEHIEDPLYFIESKIADYNANLLIFSTLTHDWDIPPRDWYYYAFESGQHISLYKKETLRIIAKKIGWHYLPISESMHIFSKKTVSIVDRILITNRYRIISYIYRIVSNYSQRSKSKLISDFEDVKKDVIFNQKKEL